MAARAKIGEILLEAGLIDRFQLDSAIGHQHRWGGRLGTALIRLGFVEEDALVRALCRQLGFPAASLEGKRVAPEVLDLIPGEIAEKYGCIPLFVKREGGKNVLHLGLSDPSDLAAIDDLSFRTGMRIRPVLVGPTQLHDAIARAYHGTQPPAEECDAFPETLLEPGDTAPLLARVPEPEILLDTPPVPAAEPAPASIESPVDVPLEPSLASFDASSVSEPPASAAKPRDVATRTILHALTQILIERGVIGREELLARVRALDAAFPHGDD